MKRVLWMIVLALLAGGLTWAEVSGRLGIVGERYREWVGAPTAGAITLVEFDRLDGDTIPSLDAALLVRAVEPFSPKAVIFWSPVAEDGNRALLRSKLGGVDFPVEFRTTGELPESLAAAQGESITVDFGDLMVAKMRGEQGLISPKLDAQFRDRIVVGELRSFDGQTLSRREPAATPWWLVGLPVLLIASVPLWPGDRTDRVVVALILAGCWLLAALAAAPEWSVLVPSAAVILLPVAAAFGRRGANRTPIDPGQN